MPLAFTRAVSPRLAEGELTHLTRTPIDLRLADAQHRAYEAALTAACLTVVALPPLPEHPDGVFVEDAAIILGRHAVITRPGAASRRGETASVARALADHLEVHALPDGRLDGGDVMLVGRTLYVGRAEGGLGRTDTAGVEALRRLAAPLGYETVAVDIRGCLHLKTCATCAGRGADGELLVVADPAHVDPAVFAPAFVLCVAPANAEAVNTVRAGDALLVAVGHDTVADALAARGFSPVPLDTSEFRKVEAALSCLSLLAMEA